MAYWDQAQLSRDGDFNQRIGAAAAVEVELAGRQPLAWADERQWQISASPGFADAYASAVVSGNPRPGQDGAVITDGMILSAIQALYPDELKGAA